MRTLFILILAALAVPGSGASDPAQRPSDDQLRQIGKRIYRQGLRPSGEPVQAYVSGDVPVAGTQFTCVSCHNRSGMGASEGVLIAPMITRAALYNPATGGQKKRPAYSDDTLAVAIREGVDAGGNRIEPPMPRYELSDVESKGLIAYLKSLSAEISPGVTPEEIHFATVVTEDVDAEPMLELMRLFFEEKNAGTRHETRRAEDGPWFRANRNEAYRKWILHVWELKGPETTWGDQLDRYYAEQPVFALIAGMSSGGWQPVHDFCESRELPGILPIVDLPVVSPTDYYTLYFSQGVALEARAIAEHVVRNAPGETVLQIVQADRLAEAAAETLSAALVRQGQAVTVRLDLESGADPEIERERVVSNVANLEPAIVVLWLGPEELARVSSSLEHAELAARVYLSATLVGDELSAVPERLQHVGTLAQPFSLSDEFSRRFDRIKGWLEHRGIEIGDPRLLAETYFACMVVGEALMHVRYDYFYRDYFLEVIDHFYTIMNYSAAYPNPTFGPGQRYLSKGCYMIDLAHGDQSGVAVAAEWIVPSH